MTARFAYAGPSAELERRELLGEPVARAHARALSGRTGPADWTITLGDELLFDAAGLDALASAVTRYDGPATELALALAPGPALRRDYYSLQALENGAVPLLVSAKRAGGDGSRAALAVPLEVDARHVPLPDSMGGPEQVEVPRALLVAHRTPHDLLFANQIALVSALAARVKASPRAWLAGALAWRRLPLPERIALAYRDVHPGADVHPTAVVEGSVIGAGARIGAHAVVRFSMIGAGARVHDGAKVELSVVGAGAWLMHDLVLYRSVVEAQVFLIHGPYQFSCFHRASAMFATILMDYRADGRPIRVATPDGARDYGGRFLGAVVGEDARVLGGCLLAPGRVVPRSAWLTPDPAQVHTLSGGALPAATPLPPDRTRRKSDDRTHDA